MSIIVDGNTRVVIQGITGKEGAFHTRQMVEYGTRVVAGITPGKGGRSFDGIPVFDTVRDARAATGANVSAIFQQHPVVTRAGGAGKSEPSLRQSSSG